MKIEVAIGRLVLDGVDLAPGEEPRLRAAVEAELGRLLAHGGLDPRLLGGGALASLSAAPIRLPAVQAPGPPATGFPHEQHSTPEPPQAAAGVSGTRLGQQIGRAVYGSLRG
jgi:hypothetical protein